MPPPAPLAPLPKAKANPAGGGSKARGPLSFLWKGTFDFNHVSRVGREEWEVKCPFHKAGRGERKNLQCRKTVKFTAEDGDSVGVSIRALKVWCLEGRHWHQRVNHVRKCGVDMCGALETDEELDRQLEAALLEPNWVIPPFLDDPDDA